MVGILLMTHAPLGEAFLAAVAHVFRNKVEHLEAIDVVADQDLGDVQALAAAAIRRLDDGSGVLVIGGQPVPFSLARIPQGSEVRGNLAAGGLGVARAITPREREIAETVAPILWQRGLLLVGLDAIGDCLTEVNVTSPTCFQEISEQTGFDVPAMFIDALEAALAG